MRVFGLFHLNMNFSSIRLDQRADVLAKCYWPLLRLIEEAEAPFGVELSGLTAEVIEALDPAWISSFRKLLESGKASLVGSGYVQAIGPLLPAAANRQNLVVGQEVYERIFGRRATIALVNEMSLSSGMIGHYLDAGIEVLVMDRDNVELATAAAVPDWVCDEAGRRLPVIWTDSVLFQKFQRFAHGDLSEGRYLNYLSRWASTGRPLPIYSNDAEVFDFRPGRFATEGTLHPEGEWHRLTRLLVQLRERGAQWCRLEALPFSAPEDAVLPSSARMPVPVKKQAKYNLSRWAVTGRDDLMLNSTCHRLTRCPGKSRAQWRQLLKLWSSDLRTHITAPRWDAAQKELADLCAELDLEPVDQMPATGRPLSLPERCEDGTMLPVNRGAVRALVSLRRGLTLDRLEFASMGTAGVGTLEHGCFDAINLAADYYSAGIVLELPRLGRRVTDLSWVEPTLSEVNDLVVIEAAINTDLGPISKSLTIPNDGEWVEVRYDFPGWERPVGSMRLNAITLLPEAFSGALTVRTHNGGDSLERFEVVEAVNHGRPANTMVSSSAGFGGTEGYFDIGDAETGFAITWDPGLCALMPMLFHDPAGLTRVILSVVEIDGSTKEGGRLPPLVFRIQPREPLNR
jgi:hypothetical protein